jgi:hypothetical protein
MKQHAMDTYRPIGGMGEYHPFGDDLYPFVTLTLYGYDEQRPDSAASPSKIQLACLCIGDRVGSRGRLGSMKEINLCSYQNLARFHST